MRPNADRSSRIRFGRTGVIVFAAFFLLADSLQATEDKAAQEPPAVILAKAKSEIARSDYAKAETLYRRLLTTAPQEAEVVDGLALSLYLQGKDSEAIGILRLHPSSRPDEKASSILISSHCRLKQYDKAADALKYLRHWPDDDALLAEIASCVTLIGEPLDGVAVYSKLVRDKAQPEDEFAVGLARAYILASRAILSRLKDLPDAEPYIRAIDSAQTLGSAGAANVFETAQQLSPSLSRDISVDDLARLLAEHSNQAATVYGAGVILGERGMASYLDAEERFPAAVPLRLFHAEMLISADRHSEAIEQYQAILRDNPNAPGMHFRIGQIYGSDNRCDLAMAEFRIQEKITPTDERVQEAIANCLIKADKFQEAYRYLKPFAIRPDASESTLMNFATASQNTEHSLDEQKALLRIEAMDPASAKTRYLLFQLYKANHESAKAAQELAVYFQLKKAKDQPCCRPE
jgi:Flp pilus assembly protein TadD